jgi:hypothetical protein
MTTLLKQLLQRPADALIASSKKLPNKISESLMGDPHLSEKFYPYKADQTFYILLKSSEQNREKQLPTPPQDLWEGYGKTVDSIINHPEKVYDTGGRASDGIRNLLVSYDKKENFSNLDFSMFTIFRGPESQVFYDIAFLRQHWGRILKVLSITPEAYGYQTAIVLEKSGD